MSEEFGFTNIGDSGIQPIKVEKKEPTLHKMSDEKFKELAAEEDKIDGGLTAISPELLNDLQHTDADGAALEERNFERVNDPRERTELEKEVDAEIIAKGKDAVNDFDESQAITVTPKKKRGRPAKKEMASFPCKSCGETITDLNVMKIGAGVNRYAAFCPFCQRSLGWIDEAFQAQVSDLVKNNPTGKDEKKASA